MWKIVDSGVNSASSHMQRDADLLQNLEIDTSPVLHFYEWQQNSATHGYFIKPEEFLHLENAKLFGLEIARRPTGGGIVFHQCDLAFSVLFPISHPNISLNVMNNYAFVNEIVKKAIVNCMGDDWNANLLEHETEETADASKFCMAKPTKYDVIIKGQKVGGAAQRLTKFGLLHQGTISISFPSVDFLKKVLLSENILSCMQKNSCLLLKEYDEGRFCEMKEKLKQSLIKMFVR